MFRCEDAACGSLAAVWAPGHPMRFNASSLTGFLLLLAAGTAGPVAHAATPAAKAPSPPACEVHPGLGEALDFNCLLTALRPGQHFVFRATFEGGHDDTMASLVAQLDGVAIDCDAGSKTRLMGEDGTVSLDCRVSPTGMVGAVHHLDIALAWSHAQYARYEITGD